MTIGPLVSVVIPTYNRGHVLREAIDSVLAQTYRNFEIVVADDGSTDDTGAVLATYGDRIKVVVRPSNGGASAARNDAIRRSTGELVCFLDSDDVYLPTRLQVAVEFLMAHSECGAVYTDMLIEYLGKGPPKRWISTPSPLPSGRIFEALLRTEPYCLTNPLSITVRREIVDKVQGFDESLTWCEDGEFWWRVSRETAFGYVAVPTCILRRGPRTPPVQSRLSAGFVVLTQKVLTSYPGLTRQERRAALQLHCYNLRLHGSNLAAEGQLADALRAWATALRVAICAGMPGSAAKTALACALGGNAEAAARRVRAFGAKCASGVSGLLQRAGNHG